jgi:hypothetical protein
MKRVNPSNTTVIYKLYERNNYMFQPLGHLQVDSRIITGKNRVQPLVLHIINNEGGGERDLVLQ